MRQPIEWTIRDLELFPEPLDDTRREIIGGVLYVSTQPHLNHQVVCYNVAQQLSVWSKRTRAGRAFFAPGVIFSDRDAVAPDVVWVSAARLASVVQRDGKLHAAPDLMAEVLSPGRENERRDLQLKLDLYSRWGVLEYWIVDWGQRRITVHRRESAVLGAAATLDEGDVLESPLLPGFQLDVRDVFEGLIEAQ